MNRSGSGKPPRPGAGAPRERVAPEEYWVWAVYGVLLAIPALGAGALGVLGDGGKAATYYSRALGGAAIGLIIPGIVVPALLTAAIRMWSRWLRPGSWTDLLAIRVYLHEYLGILLLLSLGLALTQRFAFFEGALATAFAIQVLVCLPYTIRELHCLTVDREQNRYRRGGRILTAWLLVPAFCVLIAGAVWAVLAVHRVADRGWGVWEVGDSLLALACAGAVLNLWLYGRLGGRVNRADR
ncbi:MAG: hypothetical protein HZA54_01180 [Planctomycetes bacterium]|nr:hypothetical protein [Planctomycetota bacterium]